MKAFTLFVPSCFCNDDNDKTTTIQQHPIDKIKSNDRNINNNDNNNIIHNRSNLLTSVLLQRYEWYHQFVINLI